MSHLPNLWGGGGGGGSYSAPTLVSKAATYNASGTTANIDLFTVTGAVILWRIWTILDADFGANHTGALLRLTDGVTTTTIASAGTAFSAFTAGSVLWSASGAGNLLGMNAALSGVTEAGSDTQDVFQWTTLRVGVAATLLQYRYSTTDAPTVGSSIWYASYSQYAAGGALTP